MKKQLLFFDMEFTGLHQNTTPISLGIVDKAGNEFYAEFIDYDESQVNDWIRENVINQLQEETLSYRKAYLMSTEKRSFMTGKVTTIEPATETKGEIDRVEIIGTKDKIGQELVVWLSRYQYSPNKVYFWSDCLSYDWVLINELWGGAMSIQEHISYIPLDICTLFEQRGIDPDIQREKFAYGEFISEMMDKKHNALWDARVIKKCYQKLTEIVSCG